MPTDKRLIPFFDVFKRVATFIDSPELAGVIHERHPEPSLPQQIAAGALAWSARQMRAITLLFENGASLESQPIIRSLMETMFTVAWIGSDGDRAEQYRDAGFSSMRKWINAIEEVVPSYFPQRLRESIEKKVTSRTGKEAQFPSKVWKLAENGRIPLAKDDLLKKAYNVSYRRLSIVVHADARLWELIGDEREFFPVLDAQDAAASEAYLLAAAGDVLGVLGETGAFANELIRVAKRSQKGESNEALNPPLPASE